MATVETSTTITWRCEPPVRLAAGEEVHLWMDDGRDLYENGPHEVAKLLSAEERHQQQRFLTPELQLRFGRRRTMLRKVLSVYQPEVLPEQWRFIQNTQGRPAVDPDRFGNALHFNLSHSNGRTLVAIAAREEVGVDIEHTITAAGANHLDVAEHYFTPFECRYINEAAPGDRLPRFFDLWTLKESYIKARGLGLSLPLDHFEFALNDHGAIVLHEIVKATATHKSWHFQLNTLAAHYRYALALQHPNAERIVVQHFDYSQCLPVR